MSASVILALALGEGSGRVLLHMWVTQSHPSFSFSPYTIRTPKLTLMGHLGDERLYFGPPAMTRRSCDGEVGKNVLWALGKTTVCNVDKVENKVIWAKGGERRLAERTKKSGDKPDSGGQQHSHRGTLA